MVKIVVTGGLAALVDDEDAALAEHKWHKEIRKRKHAPDVIYASRRTPSPERCKIYMHREIMGFPNGDVDHRDGNGLNNQRYNLRCATRSQNSGAMIDKPRKSRFRGVVISRGRCHWIAQISINSRQTYLGRFSREEEAALAYNAAATAHFGEFAVLNQV